MAKENKFKGGRIVEKEVRYDSFTGSPEFSFTVDTSGMDQKAISDLFCIDYSPKMSDFLCDSLKRTVWNPKKNDPMAIKNVEFNPPLTVVIWEDGTKTFVKCGKDDVFDPEKGLAMAIAKKAMGNKFKSTNIVDVWVEKKWSEDKNATIAIPTTNFVKEAIFEFPLNEYDYMVSDDIVRGETILKVRAKI